MGGQVDSWQIFVALTHLYRDMMRVVEQETGMSQTRMEILHELFHADELSQADLQQHLGVEGAVVTRIVKQLEAAGLVSRRPDPHDNRFTLVSLSAEARLRQTGADTAQFKEKFAARLGKGLDEAEQTHLLTLLQLLQDNITTTYEQR